MTVLFQNRIAIQTLWSKALCKAIMACHCSLFRFSVIEVRALSTSIHFDSTDKTSIDALDFRD